ncbi:hypothetical protein RRG08_033450 [Elysia crispata]|uniref:Uncharacterized protein n=1 Tax=Elysia crispata TaxID=231223 RepID=A0AAE1E5S1_9GAST|nr:hypothetical protein RRG08_033450 [Elysia crispata]
MEEKAMRFAITDKHAAPALDGRLSKSELTSLKETDPPPRTGRVRTRLSPLALVQNTRTIWFVLICRISQTCIHPPDNRVQNPFL